MICCFSFSRLNDSTIPIRFCTNESQLSQRQIYERLKSIGISLESHQVFSPVPAAKKILRRDGLRPYTIVHDKVVGEFEEFDKTDPNCVLLGDATNNFSYENLDEAFRVLLKHPKLFTMGYG